jgi:Zn-dependent protease
MIRYFQLVPSRLSLVEFCGVGGGLKGAFAWALAKAGLVRRLGDDVCVPDHLTEVRVAPDAIPEDARLQLQPWIRECEALGFIDPVWHQSASRRGVSHSYFVSMRRTDGAGLARLLYTVARAVHPPRVRHYLSFISPLASGHWVVSSSGPRAFSPPAGVHLQRQPGATPEALWTFHQAQRNRVAAETGCELQMAPDAATAEAWSELYERVHVECWLERGLLRPLTQEELEAEAPRSSGAGGAIAGDAAPETVAFLVALDQLINPSGSRSSAFRLLLFSLLLFLVAGGSSWPWNFVLTIVVVLLIHELGHYLAMRAFKYRNLRMFFIPFFGAAVTGRNFNVKGWQKAVVSLMGPLPGIVLGTVASLAGALWQLDWLQSSGLVALLLNVINLLPVLPLDGGWYLHAILFCRHMWLEVGFRVLAVATLAGYGVWANSPLWIWLGAVMAVALPRSIRVARIVHALRGAGVQADSADQQTIPPETALGILAHVRAASRGPEFVRSQAMMTLNVFEGLNAVPPSWAATVGLLAVYAGCFVVAIAGAGVTTLIHAEREGRPMRNPHLRHPRSQPGGDARVSSLNWPARRDSASPGLPPPGSPAADTSAGDWRTSA